MHDKISTPVENEWLVRGLGERVVHYEYYQAGHLTPLLGADTSSMLSDLVALLRKYST